MLCFIGSVCAPSRLRTMLFSVLLQGRITLFHLRCLGLALFLALARIWWAFIPFAQRLDSELQHARSRLAKSLEKISTARGRNCTPLFALSPIWKKNPSFHPCLSVPRNKKQKVATGLLLDKLHKQDFAGLLSSRASRVLGPSIRYRVSDMLSHM